MDGPNVIKAGWSLIWARRVRKPRAGGSESVDHSALASILESLTGPGRLGDVDAGAVSSYVADLERVDPDRLTRLEALGFWLNLYNVAAIRLAKEAFDAGRDSVLRVKGAFDDPVVEIAGEKLSLSDIEHGKIRRFKDPRIHGSLVCGSLSCPTLRAEPFVGDRLDAQLQDQMTTFARSGAIGLDRARGVVSLSRIFLWYGTDFARPRRMPTLLPASKRRILESLIEWIPEPDRRWVETERPDVQFQSYDWGVGCSVGPTPSR